MVEKYCRVAWTAVAIFDSLVWLFIIRQKVWTATSLLMPDMCHLCTGGRGGGFRGGRGSDRGGRGGGRGRGDFKPKMKIDSATATGSKVTFD